MSNIWSDEPPKEPGDYRVLDAETEWVIRIWRGQSGVLFVNRESLGEWLMDHRDVKFGPRIPSAEELASLRERAEMLDWLENTRTELTWNKHPMCGWLVYVCSEQGVTVIDAIRAAMSAEKAQEKS